MQLRKVILVWSWAASLLITSAAQAQLVLNAGDSATYSFNTLSHIFSDTSQSRFMWPNGALFVVDGNTSPSFNFRLEIFENTLSGLPIASRDFNRFDYTYSVFADSALRDLQGAFRVTVNSGTLFLETGQLFVYIWGPSSTEGYGVALPVPEPSVFSLLGLALLALIVWKRKSGNNTRRLTMRCSEPGHRVQVAVHASRGPGR